MGFRVRISQDDSQGPDGLAVDTGQSILEAALAAGIPWPHGCRSGNCGSCKSELLSGEVEMSPYSEYALTGAERDSGLILACRSVPWSDCEVAWLDAGDTEVFPSRRLRCRVVSVEPATHDIRIVRLRIEDDGPLAFAAGQFAEVTFDGMPPRDYSMANQPGGAELIFHIRAIAGGRVSAWLAENLGPGDSVRLEAPFGTSYFRAAHRGPVLALAGGSGLAPILSIVEAALAADVARPVRLLFGVRAERDVYLEDRLWALAAGHDNFSFDIILSAPEGPTARRSGLLHEALAAEAPDLDGTKVYLAGPPAMVEAATAVVRELGARRQDCHADAFYTGAEKAALEAAG